MAVGSYSLKKLGKEWLPSVEVMLDLAKQSLDLSWKYESNNTEEIKIALARKEGLTSVTRKDTISRIQTASYRSPIRMMHPDEWVIDDWLDESMGDMQEGERKFRQELLGTRTADYEGAIRRGTIVTLLGTILREGDLLDKMSKGELGTFTFYGKFPCYKGDPVKKIPMWERRPEKYLQQQLKDQGDHIFQVEYLLDPISDESALIKNDWLDRAKKAGKLLSYGRLRHSEAFMAVQGNDFQMSPKGDYGVMLSMEVIDFQDHLVKEPRIRILDLDRYRGKDEFEVLDKIFNDYNKYNHDLVGFEDNGFQAMFGNRALRDRITFPLFRYKTSGKTYKMKSRVEVQHSGKGMDRQQIEMMARHNIGLLRSTFSIFDIALPTKTHEDREITANLCKELRGWQWDVSRGRYIHKGEYKDVTLGLLIALITLDMALGSTVDVGAVDLDDVGVVEETGDFEVKFYSSTDELNADQEGDDIGIDL